MRQINFKLISFFTYLFFLMSCSSEENVEANAISDKVALTRSAGNMTVEITKLDRSTVNLTIKSISIGHLAGSGFSVVTNPGELNANNYVAQSIIVVEPDNEMRAILNPGANQTTYTNKGLMNVSDDDQVGLRINLSPGNINTTAFSIGNDEVDGF